MNGVSILKIKIRPIERDDAEKFEYAFLQQGWHKSSIQFIEYYKQQKSGLRKVFVAEFDGQLLGYVTLMPEAGAGPFKGMKIPEIVDFNVLKNYQRNGVGSALLDAAEAEASKVSDCVCLGVGLHSGYGSAQRMYVKRGYVPDGSGVWYNGEQLGEMVPTFNDDDLNLFFKKELKALAHNRA